MINWKVNLCVVPFLLSFFFSLIFSNIAFAQPMANTTAGGNVWNLKNVDIHTVITAFAEQTGKNFVISPQVAGKVTFISSHPLNKEEAYQALLALLEASGFQAIEKDSIIKIIPETYMKEEGSAILYPHQAMKGNEIAVTVVRVKYVAASELVKALRQLVFHFGYIEVYPETNDLIISDRMNNIKKILSLIRELDRASATKVDVIHLRNAQASDLVSILSTLLQQKGEGGGITLAADDRSNNILVKGGTPEQHFQIRSLVLQLDVPLSHKGMNTEVIYLKYLRAEKVAVVLNGLIENYNREKTGKAPTTQPAAPAASSPASTTNTLIDYAKATSQANTSEIAGSMDSTTSNFNNMSQKKSNSGSLSPYVQWEESTNAIVVSAPAELIAKLKGIVAKLDIRRPQVLIEAVIAEVESERLNELGIELNTGGRVQLLTRFNTALPLSTIGANDNISISNPPTPNAVGEGLSGAWFSGNKLRVLIRALENDTRSNILSTPNIVTLDNEPAQIKVGQKISFSIGQIQNNPTGGNPFNFFNQEDVGLILTINPQITPDGSIKLIIQQELSSVLPGQVSAGNNPNLSERFIHTTVMANNGDILVLGGLIQNDWQEVTSKVPFLGDLPAIGVLFRSHSKQLQKRNLMIFLRPTILYDHKETVHIVGSKYEYLRQQQLATEKDSYVTNRMQSPVLPILNNSKIPPPFLVDK